MKLHLALALLSLSLFFGASAETTPPKTLRVLFVGNSLTYRNNLPAMVAAMAASSGKALIYEKSTIGGAALEKHWAKGDALAKIQKGQWDYVILQELSRGPMKNKESMFVHGRLFDAEIKKVKAQTLLYMTWELEIDPKSYSTIVNAYTALSKELGAQLVPAGIAWHMARNSGSATTPALYLPDHKHPTPAGSYLAACVFYRVLFGTPSEGLPSQIESKDKPLVSLTAEEAAYLQKIADAIPLESPSLAEKK